VPKPSRALAAVALILAALAAAMVYKAIIAPRWSQNPMEEIPEEASKYAPFKLRGVYGTWSGKEGVEKLVARAEEGGFNLIIWFVNPRWGEARYRTKYYPCGSDCEADILAHLIEEAHKRGIRVWAWFDFMGYRELLEEHPDWAAVYPDGVSALERPCRGNYPLNPAHPEVVEFWRNALLELVEKYDIDGVNFEDDYGYGYCGESYSYDEHNRRKFEEYLRRRGIEVTLEWPDDVMEGGELYNLWIEYKCEVVENVTRLLYEAVKSVKPHVEVSLAATPDLKWSKRAYGIDWVKLAEEGLFDYLTFMLYSTDDEWVSNTASKIFKTLEGAKAKPIIIIGWELRRSPPEAWVRQALLVRKVGGEDIIVFWDDGLERTGSWGAFARLFSSMRG